MSTLTFPPMSACPANAAARPGPFARLRTLFAQWSAREFDRAQLAKWDERDLHDAGISRVSLEYELNKPFWRS